MSDADLQLDFLPSLLLPLTELYCEEYKDYDNNQLKDASRDVFLSIKMSREDSKNIEDCTRNQRESDDWYEQRCGRLTASTFHDVLARKTSSNPDVIVKRLVKKQDLSHLPAIKWGIEHEEEAREAYITKISSSHENLL